MGPVAGALIEYFERTRRRPLVVASHPRSGTHLLIDCLRLNFPECRSWKYPGENLNRLYLHLDELAKLTPAEAVALARRAPRVIFKTHAMADFSAASLTAGPCPCDPDLVAWLRANAGGFLYVYRDGRDVMKSLHALVRETGAAAGVPLGPFIRQQEHGLSRPCLWARHVSGWVAEASVLCVAMETLVRRPDVALSGAAERFGLRPDRAGGWRLPNKPRTLLALRLARLFTRHPRSTAIAPGRTVERPWQELFGRDDRAFFLREVGDLLIKLGYEESDDWVDPGRDGEPRFPAGYWASAEAARPTAPPGASPPGPRPGPLHRVSAPWQPARARHYLGWLTSRLG